ncbi:MAG: hypothetical protein CMB47_07065 [Euryarchaeota archaeon]|nr:hypothetical protein [Euryarchaeota archaeon]|tara:strand:- start:707 stop:1441 length:735 start_codon:yes stop_codon:yes gene_type:complete
MHDGFIHQDTNTKVSMIFNNSRSYSAESQTFNAEAADPCASGVLYIRPHPVRGNDLFQYSYTGSSWSNIGAKEEGGSNIGIVGSAEERAKSKAGSAGWAFWDDAKDCITEASVCSSGTDGIVIFKSGGKFGLLDKSSKLLGWEKTFKDAKLGVGARKSCYIDRTNTSAMSNVTVYDYDKFVNDPDFYITGEGSASYTPPADDDDDDGGFEPLAGQVKPIEPEIPMAVKIGIPVVIIGAVIYMMK